MTMLAKLAITTAVSAQTTPVLQIRPGPGGQRSPDTAILYANLTYGSGGTTIDAWVQTSVDGGSTWIDVANFHFTTASAKFLFTLNSATSVTTEYTPTDGTLTANTAKDGIIGSQWRVKYTTVGTYAGNTTLQIDAAIDGLTSLP